MTAYVNDAIPGTTLGHLCVAVELGPLCIGAIFSNCGRRCLAGGGYNMSPPKMCFFDGISGVS